MSLAVRKTLVLFLAISFVAAPQIALSAEMDDARMAAEADAKSDVSSWLWLGAGCLFNLLGVGAAYVILPSPPASRLLGKSHEYVAVYTDSYQAAARNIQVKNALIGCGLSAVGWVLYWVFWVVIFGAGWFWAI